MILYFAPGACSLADHIALIEAVLPYSLIRVDRSKRTEDGRDYLTVNPRGYVPALELDKGSILTENIAILAYIAQQSSALFAADDLMPWRALEAISFMSTAIHGNLVPFWKDLSVGEKDRGRRELVKHISTIDDQLNEQPFLLGDRMSIADPYLFWALRSVPVSGIALPERLQSQPHEQRAFRHAGFGGGGPCLKATARSARTSVRCWRPEKGAPPETLGRFRALHLSSRCLRRFARRNAASKLFVWSL